MWQGGVTADLELKGVVYKLVAFMGTNGLFEKLKYVVVEHPCFPYVPYFPVDDVFRVKPSIFGHKPPRFGVLSNFWENYAVSEWTRKSSPDDMPVIFTEHSRGGAVADIEAWHAATFQGLECKNMAVGYSRIGTVSFGQPAVFTSFLSEYVDGFSKGHSFKVGFSNDDIYKKFNHLWSVSTVDSRHVRCSII